VVRELGINEASLGHWVSAFKARNNTGEPGITKSERAELLRLRKRERGPGIGGWAD
jgi:transposase